MRDLMLLSLMAFITGFFLDLLLGDPHWLPHPVKLMGLLIEKGEKVLRPLFPQSPRGQLVAGAILAAGVPLLCFLTPFIFLGLLWHFSPWLFLAAESIMCWQVLAVRSLRDESLKVYRALAAGDLAAARRAVSMIVGRDTDQLDPEGIAKAAIETIAENTSDGAIAPMLFLALGGAPLGLFYKAVNTLDSMVGYKNQQYLYFGRSAARLDDLLNFLPARISAGLMLAASAVLGLDHQNAFRVFRRDRLNHASPNSGHTEAVCAGALGVRLAGDAYYFGKLYRKQTIGDPLRAVEPEDILQANRLLYATAALCFVLCIALKAAVILMI